MACVPAEKAGPCIQNCQPMARGLAQCAAAETPGCIFLLLSLSLYFPALPGSALTFKIKEIKFAKNGRNICKRTLENKVFCR